MLKIPLKIQPLYGWNIADMVQNTIQSINPIAKPDSMTPVIKQILHCQSLIIKQQQLVVWTLVLHKNDSNYPRYSDRHHETYAVSAAVQI